MQHGTKVVSKPLKLFLCFSLFMTTGLCAGDLQKKANIRCSGPNGKTLMISYQGSQAEVLETGSKANENQKWTLPTMINLSDPPRKPIRFFTSYHKTATHPASSLFEIQEQYDLEGQGYQIKLAVLKEGQPLSQWKCVPTGFSANIKLSENITDFIPAERLWATQIARGFVTEDKLNPSSVEMLQYSLSKYLIWKKQLDAPSFKRMISESCRSLTYLSPKALKNIEAQLSNPEIEIWKEVLEMIDFQGSAAIQRWLFWAKLLNDNNKEAFRMALREFAKSSLSTDKDTRALFVKEVSNGIKEVPSNVQGQLKNEKWDLNEKELVSEIFGK